MPSWKPITHASEIPPLGTVESEHLDFKRQAWKGGTKGSNEQLRDVAQFANHLGGSLIVGADEDNGGRLCGFVRVSEADKVVSRLRDLCYAHLSPRVELHCSVLEAAPGTEVVVANVPPSVGPVGIKHDDKWEFCRRYGNGKQPIDFAEVERMWSEGRRGRLILNAVPADRLEKVSITMVGAEPPLMDCTIVLFDSYFQVIVPRFKRTWTLPYEVVRASWPAVKKHWVVHLSVEPRYIGAQVDLVPVFT